MASNLLQGIFIGTVMRIDKEKRRLGVFLPKLMPTMSEGSVSSYAVPTNNGLKVGDFSTNVSDVVRKTNYIMAKPKDWTTPLPEIGSKVQVRFIDDSPSQAIWDIFDPNGDNEIIPEERYPKSFTLSIGGKSIDINASDSIVISLPDHLSIASYSDGDKTKRIDLIEDAVFANQTKALREEVDSLRKTVDWLLKSSRADASEALSAIAWAGNPGSYADKFGVCKSTLLSRIENAADLEEIASASRLGRKLLPELNGLYSDYRAIYSRYSALDDATLSKMPDFSIGDLKSGLDSAFVESMACDGSILTSIAKLRRAGLATSFAVTYKYAADAGDGLSTTKTRTCGIFDELDALSDALTDDETMLPAFPEEAAFDMLTMRIGGAESQCYAFKHKWYSNDGSMIVYADKTLVPMYFGFYMSPGYEVKIIDEAFGYSGYSFKLDGSEHATLESLNAAIKGIDDENAHSIHLIVADDGVDLTSDFAKSI